MHAALLTPGLSQVMLSLEKLQVWEEESYKHPSVIEVM